MLIKKIYFTFILLLSNFLISSDKEQKIISDDIFVKLKIQVDTYKKYYPYETRYSFYAGSDFYSYVLKVSNKDSISKLKEISLSKMKNIYGDNCEFGALVLCKGEHKIILDKLMEKKRINSFQDCLAEKEDSQFEGNHFVCQIFYNSKHRITDSDYERIQYNWINPNNNNINS